MDLLIYDVDRRQRRDLVENVFLPASMGAARPGE